MKTLTQTYQQVAANHIRRARTSVIKNRDFVTELLFLFQDVKNAYKNDLVHLMKKKKIKDTTHMSLLKRNGKTTYVFMAANTGLYGSIVNKTAILLGEYLDKNEAEVTIIGKVGEAIFQQRYPGKKYTFFEFPDNAVEPEKLKSIITHLLAYEQILVFYGQFQSIVSQEPIIASLDGNADIQDGQERPLVRYLFEPSLEKIIVFFETEIFGLIFEQTMRESQLAKHASRMFALDRAIQNINTNLGKVQLQKHILHHRIINGKQLNSLSGMSLWSKNKR